MLRRPVSAAPLKAASALALVAGLFVLSACGPGAEPVASPTAETSPAPDSEAAPDPVLVPDGTAEDNLPVFTRVSESIWTTDQQGSGRAYIDALIAAGFDRAAMQVTQDLTTVGNTAESLQFSVRWGDDECLIGQVGPSTGQVVTAVMPQLAEGRCLVGTTRPIDW
ncbi:MULTISPECIES: hypothetical protein [unclassified Microbacterium]|uniref:DUF6993 domain-containing protein n=1 Tax=unclassified Microbacterium TaxID=2609290 RepID=UPI001A9C8EDB|nr:hypothetical protein [Microbacterium sp. TPD7012]